MPRALARPRQAVERGATELLRSDHGCAEGLRPTSRRDAALKRACDVVLGSLLALGAVPVVVVLAVGIALDLRAWPFFVHRRIGQHGRPLRMPKLRTLPASTEPYLLKHELSSAPAATLCGFLRRHHLDELPQLFLVPLGRLSLVGPRPKMPDEVEPVDAAYGDLRVRVPQGCSGLWQVSPHSGGMPHDAPEYDFFYLRHRSLRLDLWIIGRTVLLMLGLARPTSLDDVPGWAWVADPSPPAA